MAKKEESTCAMPCLFKGLIIPTAVVFAVIFVFEYLFHGSVMMPHYEATADLWRSKEEMDALGHICLIRMIVVAAVISMMYHCFSRNAASCGSCPRLGAKFGLMVGLLLGMWDFGAYVWLPIPMEIALAWLFGDVVLGLLIGLVLSWLKGGICKAD